jgi:putative chitinase
MAKPDGRVDPGGGTLRSLKAGMPSGLTDDKLQAIMSGASLANINKFFPPLLQKMTANDIATPLRMAHFLAQIGHESADFRYTEEIASGEAYEGRADLGNTQPGDGKRFKGRGLIQLTGRANYQAYGDARGADYVTDDHWNLIASDPSLAVDVSCWFWVEHELNKLADADSVTQITQVINGGYNGLPDRKKRLALAKCFLLQTS